MKCSINKESVTDEEVRKKMLAHPGIVHRGHGGGLHNKMEYTTLKSVPIPQPTPYQDVNIFLNLLLSNIQSILGDHFIGLYLGGSLALGDFNPHWSDIDFAAVTVDELSPEMIAGLQAMHTSLWATGIKWARRLDGSYVSQQLFRHWTADHEACPFVEGDTFTVTTQGSAVIQRHIIYQYGVAVAGPSPRRLLDPVDLDELRRALQDMLEIGWRPLLDDPAWVRQSQMQPFAILTICRTLYTLEHGVVASKPVAARWCQQAIGQQWTELIEWALDWPHDTESSHLAATLSLIQYALDHHKHL
jgi:Aminoglycoside adenylyltransferase, C-terminal domain